MIQNSIKILALIPLISGVLSAEDIVLYKGYFNLTYDSSKNSIMAGSNTATAKGYSALQSNPAGLSTNHNISIYAKTIQGSIKDKDDYEIKQMDAADHLSVGVAYDSFGVEYKPDDYILAGGAYGYESKYGLFSAGLSYLYDDTDLTQKDTSVLARDEFATGDFITYGFMWQKTFLDENDFYAIYFGISKKNSGKYDGSSDSTIVPVSPSRLSYGIGLETNVFDTTLLFTLDMTEETWQSVNESLSGTAYGLKWLISEKLSIAGGISNQTFSNSALNDIETVGAGVEFGLLIFHFNVGVTQRTMNDDSGLYLQEDSAHVDVALTF